MPFLDTVSTILSSLVVEPELTTYIRLNNSLLIETILSTDLDGTESHINLFLHWRSLMIDFIVTKSSFFVPLYHLLCPQPANKVLLVTGVGVHVPLCSLVS